MRYYLNIGSNLGDRRAVLHRAIAALSGGTGGCMVSRIVETAPWGFESANAFLNVGVAVDSRRQPMEMLDWLQDIERRLGSGAHRNSDGTYRDRELDIDIMAIERCDKQGQWHEVTIDEPRLQVPHKHLHERVFFPEPLAELRRWQSRR